jgi:hypothetical protein
VAAGSALPFHQDINSLLDARYGFAVQANFEIGGAGNFAGVGMFGASAADSSFYLGFSTVNDLELTRYVTGSATDQDFDSTLTGVASTWYTVRMTVAQNGSNVDLRGLAYKGLSAGSELTNDLTQYVALTNKAYPTGSDHIGVTSWQDNTWDEIIVMGNGSGGAITMDGLPTGYKLQIDSRAAVTESGGTATIAMSTWETYSFPAATVKVLDAGDSIVETLSVTIWGGASMTYTAPTTSSGLLIDYQLTVFGIDDTAILTPRAGAAHSDEFIATTATDWYGAQYLYHPRGRRGQLDILSGVTDTGGLSIDLLDAKSGSSGSNAIRWVTAFIGDSENISQLCGLKVLIKERVTDSDGSTISDFFTGRIDSVALSGKGKITLKLQDMASDLNYKIFTGVFLGEDNRYAAKAAPEMNSGEAAYASYGHRPSLAPLGLIDRDEYLGGTENYGDFVTTPWLKGTWTVSGNNRYIEVDRAHTAAELRMVTDAWPGVSGNPRTFGRGVAQRNHKLRVRVRRDTDSSFGDFHWGQISSEEVDPAGWESIVSEFFAGGGNSMGELQRVPLDVLHTDDGDYKAFGDFSNGDTVYMYVYSIADPTKASPIYIDDVHPVQLLQDILDGFWGTINIDGTARRTFPYDSTSFTALLTDGTIKNGRWIIKKPEDINKWIEENICKPYQIGYRLNGSGEMVIFSTARPTTATLAGVATIDSDDVRADTNSGWNQTRKEAVTLLTYEASTEVGPTSRDDTGGDLSLEALVNAMIESINGNTDFLTPVAEEKNSITYLLAENDNLKTKGLKKHTVKLTGLHSGFNKFTLFGISFSEAARSFADRHKETIKALFSHGPIYYSPTCHRTDATNDCQPGDWRLLSIPDQIDPANAQRGGVRAALCLERAERGLLIDFTFLDGGPNSASTAPVVNALAQGTDTNHWVDVPIDYSGFGAGNIRCVIEYAPTATSVGTIPTDDTDWFYAASHTATAADGVETVTLKNLPSNTRIWIRVRTEPADLSALPSAWINPTGNDYIDTDAYTAPSAISVDVATYGGGIVGMTVTLGDTSLETVISLKEGACGGSYETIRVLPAGVDFFILGGFDVSTGYCARAVHRDAFGGETAEQTQAFTTGATKDTAPVMADVAIVFSD